MSKIGLAARLVAILDAAERVDRMAARVYRLPPALAVRYENWQAECDRIAAEQAFPGAMYAQYLEAGEWPTPAPSRAVAEALRIERAPVLSEDMTERDAADLWNSMVAGDAGPSGRAIKLSAA